MQVGDQPGLVAVGVVAQLGLPSTCRAAFSFLRDASTRGLRPCLGRSGASVPLRGSMAALYQERDDGDAFGGALESGG